MAEHNFVEGDVVRYTPKDRWCRHGIAIVQEGGHGRDVYWGSGDGSYVGPSDLVGGELMFRMGEFREAANEVEWRKYAPEDRQYFPMGGYQQRLFVRTSAAPDLDTQIENAREALKEAEDKVTSAVRSVRWATEDLVKLEMQRESSPRRVAL